MRALFSYFAAVSIALLSLSCSVPGSAVMGGIKEGMSRDEVRSVMQSQGIKPDDSRKRPPGGWKIYGQDPFAAGSQASGYESKTGRRVEWAEVYHVARPTGATVINLYYDGSGRLMP